MRGAVAVSATLDGLTITEGADSLSVYQFHTGAAKHYFCSRCGIYTHHQRRSNGTQFGINAACLEGLSPFDFPEVPVLDGVNHPNDTGGTVHLAQRCVTSTPPPRSGPKLCSHALNATLTGI
jgi:hypothetical protein